MAKQYTDLTGQTIGFLHVDGRGVDQIYMDKSGKPTPRVMWNCTCLLCGNKTVVRGTHLKSGRIVSDGCYGQAVLKKSHVKHGKRNTKLYGVWQNIKNRCYNSNVKCYERYGARGIYVCDEWKNDFDAFYEWCMQNGYNPDAEFMQCQIDRIDNNGPYAPWNCRFVTAKSNANNRRKAKLKDQTVYKVGSISATRFEWGSIINTAEYRIKLRAKEWDIPIEMFILYVIERNAGLIKTKSGTSFDKNKFIQTLTINAEKHGLNNINEQSFRSFIAESIKKKKEKQDG